MGIELEDLLNQKYHEYSNTDFIPFDPISIPKQFTKPQDIEIAGFFAAIFSWGRRDIIIKKSTELITLMNNSPYEFIKQYKPIDYKAIAHFKHRTFNGSDLDFYIRAMQKHYKSFESLENAFLDTPAKQKLIPMKLKENLLIKCTKKTQSTTEYYNQITIEENLINFYAYFSGLVDYESRNLKHISSPAKNSACKRLCMYLRWMIRKDKVDFGLWGNIDPSQLVIPLDVHVMKIAVQLDLIDKNDKPNWNTALKLTEAVRKFDTHDPCKYDFALFGMSAILST